MRGLAAIARETYPAEETKVGTLASGENVDGHTPMMLAVVFYHDHAFLSRRSIKMGGTWYNKTIQEKNKAKQTEERKGKEGKGKGRERVGRIVNQSR